MDELNNTEKIGYSEAPIFFLPTYKIIPGKNNYDFMKGKRIPSFTDRILYK